MARPRAGLLTRTGRPQVTPPSSERLASSRVAGAGELQQPDVAGLQPCRVDAPAVARIGGDPQLEGEPAGDPPRPAERAPTVARGGEPRGPRAVAGALERDVGDVQRPVGRERGVGREADPSPAPRDRHPRPAPAPAAVEGDVERAREIGRVDAARRGDVAPVARIDDDGRRVVRRDVAEIVGSLVDGNVLAVEAGPGVTARQPCPEEQRDRAEQQRSSDAAARGADGGQSSTVRGNRAISTSEVCTMRAGPRGVGSHCAWRKPSAGIANAPKVRSSIPTYQT